MTVPVQSQKIAVHNPATGKLIKTVQTASDQDLERILAQANIGHKEWAKSSLKERAKILKSVRKALVARSEEIILSLMEETGKPRFDATLETMTALEHLRFVTKKGPRALKPQRRSISFLKTKRGSVHLYPYGVVGVISPWNYPAVLSTTPVAHALIAGNSVILKPSELTPLTDLILREIFIEGGIPEDVFQVAVGDGKVGAYLVESTDTDMICFTGSVTVGKWIARHCAGMLKPVILELGGKDPMIVLEDANLERAANAAVWGGNVHCGQVCMSVERIYVVETVADRFLELLREKLPKLRYSEDKEKSDIGPLIDIRQQRIVSHHLKEAVEKKAKITVGGKSHKEIGGYFFEPTLIEDVSHEMEVMRDETFGPVIAVMRVRDEEEAVRLANDSPFGLSGSVFTRNKRRGRRIAGQLRSGSVCINDVQTNYVIPEIPFGGVGKSGMGRVHGLEGLRSFSYIQSVCEDRFGLKREMWWFPVSEVTKRLFRWLIKKRYG